MPLLRRSMARSAKDRRASESRGRAAETACVTMLQATGWKVLAERFRPPRGQGAGEIDLIAQRGRTLAFIEVKARNAERDAAGKHHSPPTSTHRSRGGGFPCDAAGTG